MKLNKLAIFGLLLFIISFTIIYPKREGFDNIENDSIKMYVISLRREDRLKNIAEQQRKIDVDIEIFDAVKGDQLNIDKLMDDGIISRGWENGPSFKKREIGCYLSHFYIYNKIVANKLPGYTIIFEDDFKIESDNFMDDVKKAINITKGEFDLLYLGNHNSNHGELYSDNIYNVNKEETLIGTHCYIVNNKHIGKIIQETEDVDMAIDIKLNDLSQKGKLIILVMYPTIVSQGAETSNIRDMTVETFVLYNK